MKKQGQIKRCRGGFVFLLGLILTLAIILILSYLVFKVYFRMPESEEEIKQSLSGSGIDSSSYKSIVDSSRKKVKEINKQYLDRRKQLEDLK